MLGQKTHQKTSEKREKIAMMCDVNGAEVEKRINVVCGWIYDDLYLSLASWKRAAEFLRGAEDRIERYGGWKVWRSFWDGFKETKK